MNTSAPKTVIITAKQQYRFKSMQKKKPSVVFVLTAKKKCGFYCPRKDLQKSAIPATGKRAFILAEYSQCKKRPDFIEDAFFKY